jgi:serine/threonine protein kinase
MNELHDNAEREQNWTEVLVACLESAEPGRAPDREALLARYPEFAQELEQFFANRERLDRLAGPLREAVRPKPAADGREAATGALPENSLLGDFRIVREVGRGGMGIVYEAEQVSLRRRVALKVLPFAATLDATRLQRFTNEAQAAAQLHHTNIVPVFAVGCERGVHYYAMQFIDGQTLAAVIRQLQGSEEGQAPPAGDSVPTAACSPSPCPPEVGDAPTPPVAGLSTERARRDRSFYRRAAELGGQAAAALEHAHQLGVVHRDIKPANLMLDARGTLWVTDFGLAQISTGESLTLTGDLVGTLRYMSPEQALGNRAVIDQRTDIYSLGVTLYELLTLRRAFPGADRQELLRQIAFEEPRPLRKVDRGIPAELETIVLKAMAKNRDERYSTATELAEDLERFVKDEPIRARRPTLAQRLRKWGRRHRALVGAAVAVVVLTAAVSTASAVLLWRQQGLTQKQKELAEARLVQAEQAAALEKAAKEQAQKRLAQIEKGVELFAGMLTGINPRAEEKGGEPLYVQLRHKAEKAAAALEGEVVGDPQAVARLQTILGHTLLELGSYATAIAVLEKARATRERELETVHPDTLNTLNNLAGAYRAAGRLPEAIKLFEQVKDACVAKLGADHPHTLTTLNNLAGAYRATGRLPEAIKLFEQVKDARVAKLGADHLQTLATLNNLALAYQHAGRLPEAIKLFEQVKDAQVAKLGADHPETLTTLNNLAGAYRDAGRLPKAIKLLEQVKGACVAKLGADHPHTLTTLDNLAGAYRTAGRLPEAIKLFEQVKGACVAKLGADHPQTLTTLNNLAEVYGAAGRLPEALPLFEQAAQGIEKRKFLHEHAGLIVPNTIRSYEAAGQLDRAEAWQQRWLAAVKEKAGPEAPAYAGEQAVLGALLLKQEKWAGAEAVLRDCLALRQKTQPEAWTTFNTMSALGGALRGQKKDADAEPLLKEGYDGMKQRQAKIPPAARVRLAEALARLADLYEATGRQDQAKRCRQELQQAAQPKPGPQASAAKPAAGKPAGR